MGIFKCVDRFQIKFFKPRGKIKVSDNDQKKKKTRLMGTKFLQSQSFEKVLLLPMAEMKKKTAPSNRKNKTFGEFPATPKL